MTRESETTAVMMAESPGAPVCPVCGTAQSDPFLRIPALPVNCIALWKSRDDARACPRGAIDLGFCEGCGAITNQAFDPGKLRYGTDYDNSLHFSPTFQKYADELARYLLDRYALRDKNIIDVGCGNGEFLALLCQGGHNRGVGFDPSFIANRIDTAVGRGIEIVQDYFCGQYAGDGADLVICRHVLEHIPDPCSFLRQIRAALTNGSAPAVYFEVPNAAYVFEQGGIWDIIYEHCFYYTATALERLFTRSGFDVLNISEGFGGQYLCLEAQPSRPGATRLSAGDVAGLRGEALRFAARYRCTLDEWQGQLRELQRAGRRVVAWGAGAKGAMFLNAFPSFDSLDRIVDVNPHKCGLHIGGTGQRVVAPEVLIEMQPDAVLVMNGNYHQEIRRTLSEFGLTPEVITI